MHKTVQPICESCKKDLGPDELVYEVKRTRAAGVWPFLKENVFITTSNDWPAGWVHYNCWVPSPDKEERQCHT